MAAAATQREQKTRKSKRKLKMGFNEEVGLGLRVKSVCICRSFGQLCFAGIDWIEFPSVRKKMKTITISSVRSRRRLLIQ